MTKQPARNLGLATLISFALPIMFMNCSPSFNVLGTDWDLASLDAFNVRLDESLMTSDQVYLTMSELTGIAPTDTIASEYEGTSRTALSGTQKVAGITPPVMMSAANLASRFCNNLVALESGRDPSERRFFGAVDFTVGPSSIEDAEYEDILVQLSQKIWGRSLSGFERQAFYEFRSEYVGGLDAAGARNRTQTVRMMLSLCTAVLASYEAMTL